MGLILHGAAFTAAADTFVAGDGLTGILTTGAFDCGAKASPDSDARIMSSV